MIESYDMRVVSSTGKPGECLDILRQSAKRRNIYFLDVELKDPEYDGFSAGKRDPAAGSEWNADIYYQLSGAGVLYVSISSGGI